MMPRMSDTDLGTLDWSSIGKGKSRGDCVARGLHLYRTSRGVLFYKWRGRLRGTTGHARSTSRVIGKPETMTLEEARTKASNWAVRQRLEQDLEKGLPPLCPRCLAAMRSLVEVESLTARLDKANRNLKENKT